MANRIQTGNHPQTEVKNHLQQEDTTSSKAVKVYKKTKEVSVMSAEKSLEITKSIRKKGKDISVVSIEGSRKAAKKLEPLVKKHAPHVLKAAAKAAKGPAGDAALAAGVKMATAYLGGTDAAVLAALKGTKDFVAGEVEKSAESSLK